MKCFYNTLNIKITDLNLTLTTIILYFPDLNLHSGLHPHAGQFIPCSSRAGGGVGGGGGVGVQVRNQS